MVMWVSGEAAVLVDSIDDEQVLKGATRILRLGTLLLEGAKTN